MGEEFCRKILTLGSCVNYVWEAVAYGARSKLAGRNIQNELEPFLLVQP
jgi:hypothetical protein